MNQIAELLQPTPRDQAGDDGIRGTSSILYRLYLPRCPTYHNSKLKDHLQTLWTTHMTARFIRTHRLQSLPHLRRSMSQPRTSLASFVSIVVEPPSMTQNSSSSLILYANRRHLTYPIRSNARGGQEWVQTQPQNQKTHIPHS
jgi:hypothetical protein